MGVLKGFRRYNKILLAVFTALLMVSFLVAGTLRGCGRGQGDIERGTVLGETVTLADASATRSHWRRIYSLYRYSVQLTFDPTRQNEGAKDKPRDPSPLLQAAFQGWRPIKSLEDMLVEMGGAGEMGAAALFNPFLQDAVRFEPTENEVLFRVGKLRSAQAMGLRVSDTEVDQYIRALGLNDEDTRRFANDSLGIKVAELKETVREELLVLGHMAAVLSAAQPTDAELLRLRRTHGDRLTLEYVELSAADFAEAKEFQVDWNNAEHVKKLKEVYEKHKDAVGRKRPPRDKTHSSVMANMPEVRGYKLPDRARFETLQIPGDQLDRLSDLAKAKIAALSPADRAAFEERAFIYFTHHRFSYPPPPEPLPDLPKSDPKDPKTDPKAGKVEPKKVEGKVEPKVEGKVEPKVEGKVEPKVEGKVETKKTEPAKVEPKPAPKGEAKPEDKTKKTGALRDLSALGFASFGTDEEPLIALADEKPVKAEPKADAKVEPKVETKKADAKVEPKVETKKTDAKVEPKVETKKTDAKVEPKVEPKVETKKTDAKVETKKTDTKADTKATTKDEPLDPAKEAEKRDRETFAKVKDRVMVRLMTEEMIGAQVRLQTEAALRRVVLKAGGNAAKAEPKESELHPFSDPKNWRRPESDKAVVRVPVIALDVAAALKQEFGIEARYFRSDLIAPDELDRARGMRDSPFADPSSEEAVLRGLAKAFTTPAVKEGVGSKRLTVRNLVYRNNRFLEARKAREKAITTDELPEPTVDPDALNLGQTAALLSTESGELFVLRLLEAVPERVPTFEEVKDKVAKDWSVDRAYDQLVSADGAAKIAREMSAASEALPKTAEFRTTDPFQLNSLYNVDRLQRQYAPVLANLRKLQQEMQSGQGGFDFMKFQEFQRAQQSIAPLQMALSSRTPDQMLLGTRVWLNRGDLDDSLPLVLATPDQMGTAKALAGLVGQSPARAAEVAAKAFRLLEEAPTKVEVLSIPEEHRVVLFGISRYEPASIVGGQSAEWALQARSLAVQRVLRDYTDPEKLSKMFGVKIDKSADGD